jgi:hypothetical protein
MHDATDAATPVPRAVAAKRAPAQPARPGARAARTAVVRTQAPPSSRAPRTAASQQRPHRPAPAAQPHTEFIAEAATTDASATSSPATHDAPNGGAGGTEFGLESP